MGGEGWADYEWTGKETYRRLCVWAKVRVRVRVRVRVTVRVRVSSLSVVHCAEAL